MLKRKCKVMELKRTGERSFRLDGKVNHSEEMEMV